VTDTSPSKMQELLAAEFDRQGWEYDLTIGSALIEEIERVGTVDPEHLASLVPSAFVSRHGTTRPLVAAALGRALGGRRPKRDTERAATLVFADHRTYEVNLGPGAAISHSNLNLGDGQQINVNVEGAREDVLAAVDAIVSAGLTGEWNDDAVRELGAVLDTRDDLTLQDVTATVIATVERERPSQGRAKQLLDRIAVSGLGGLLTIGLSSGIGEVFSQLPL
jgi:hypothetical protein